MSESQKRILVFSSSFPSCSNPVSGPFIESLAREEAKAFQVVVLVPAVGRSPLLEERDGMKIIRFRQGLFGLELAGRPGGILPALKKNRWLLLILPFFLLSAFVALVGTVRREKIDLIHAHWVLPQGFLAAVYCFLARHRVKLLITCHGSDLLKVSGRFSGCMKRFALRQADAVTVVSELLRRKVESLGCKQSFVLPMGVDTAQFSPDAARDDFRTRMGLKRNVILFVGSLIELKGVRALVDSMAEVIRREPDTSLLLVGGGELDADLKRSVQKMGLEEHVIFAGPRLHEKLPEFFASSDIFILPSYSEGWPLVVMEALSAGLRVVVSKLPVFMDHPDRDELFLTVTKGDPADIAETLIQAVSQVKTPAAGEQRRLYAMREFDLAVVGSRYSKLMKDLLKNDCND